MKTPIWEKSRDAAGKRARNFPPEAFELYGPMIEAFRTETEKAAGAGVGPDVVVRAVEHALTAKGPKTRYLVGRNVRLQIFFKKVLPDSLFESRVRRQDRTGNPGGRAAADSASEKNKRNSQERLQKSRLTFRGGKSEQGPGAEG